ncbi:hypothetical protein [Mycobacterium sp.]|uniref:hypothetical protein n=1 Tax=Mycobacterium sp. TaxID=1785 RepID=UPI0031D82945
MPQGQFVTFLFQPFVWPVDSETGLAADSQTLSDESKTLERAGEDVRSYALKVIDGGLWVGEGADAARAAYMELASMKFDQADVSRVGAALVLRASDDVARTKRNMYTENTNAHKEIEQFLRSGSGHSLAQVAVILTTHRTTIQVHSGELHTYAAEYTTQFTGQFPQDGGNNGAGGPHIKPAGNDKGLGKGASSDDPATPPPGTGVGPSGLPIGASSDGLPGAPGPGPFTPGGLGQGMSSDGVPSLPPHSPLSSLVGPLTSGGSLPGLGSGGGGLPLSGFQGLMGSFGGFPGAGGGLPMSGLGGAGFQAPPALPSLGMSFGQGLAAGASAASGIPSVPQAPMAPLLAPLESTPSVAAPAAAVAAPVAPPAAAGAGAGSPEGMTSYGSVLPPAGAPGAGGGVPASAMPAATGGPAPTSTAATAGAGLLSVSGRRDSERVPRGVAESDLELAKMAVAELAGAASVTDPGLDWAVAVGRNASGMPTLWVATNDGATYVPPGVFLRKTMPVSAGLSDVFDARWMGWVNPAEKAVRAARECGDTVGAVATTWAWPSEYLVDHPAVNEVATGVAPSMSENLATELGLSRAHRLQTVDAALYSDLKASDEDVVRAYCRELTRQLAFGVAGDELTPVAQSVAHTLVAQQSPKAEEWAALGAEYEIAQALTGAQRPGLNGVENVDQVVSYCREFIRCRRMEALLCWEQFGGDLLNVVYAAWVAGVRTPLRDLVLR